MSISDGPACTAVGEWVIERIMIAVAQSLCHLVDVRSKSKPSVEVVKRGTAGRVEARVDEAVWIMIRWRSWGNGLTGGVFLHDRKRSQDNDQHLDFLCIVNGYMVEDMRERERDEW